MSFDPLNNNLFMVDSLGNKWLRGKVKTNVDPLNLDRIQATVAGLYDPDLGPIPWIGPLKESPFGFGDGWGTYGNPAVGSDVAILLQDGNASYPVYMHIQCFPNGAFPSGTSWGFQDPAGNQLLVKGKDVKFTTGGGFIFHIDQAGSFVLTVPDGGSGVMNVPNFTLNSDTATINATNLNTNAILTQVGNVNMNGVTIDTTGDVLIPGSLLVVGGVVFDSLVAFLTGVDITGPATNNGHNIGALHKHLNGTATGGITGIVTP